LPRSFGSLNVVDRIARAARREKRAERALECPRRDQHAEAGGRAAGGRRGGEAECADQERDLAADQGVAVHLARKRGEDVPPALLAIEEAGADAVRELRATLGVLRSEQDGDGSGLGQLDSLVARARAAGLPVTVTVTGEERPLPADVDQAAYRIVQEALTNVSRHAGLAGGDDQVSASVRLHYTPGALTVQVDDDGNGNGTRPAASGLGLIGMRERVSALGGHLQAGPQDGGGFRVRAELPARAPS
jgi:signal transduction histidine kinase